jgi:protein arginine N-methyltransferase 5
MPVCGEPDNLYVGREYSGTDGQLRDTLKAASEAKFDFVVIPLFEQPREGVEPADHEYQLQPSTASDLALDSKTWGSAVVGTLSTWIDPDPKSTLEQQTVCREALQQELAWASHLGVYGIILPSPSQPHCELYASSVGRLLLGGIYTTQLMLRIPLTRELSDGTQIDGWNMWNNFRLFCDSNARLQVALELTANLPSTDRELHRWLAEPVRAVIVPTDVFLTNKQGFPVLSKRHKNLLSVFFRHRVQVIIQGIPEGSSDEDKDETSKYLHYIARLFQQRPTLSPQEQFELPYHDYLQAPLQPLQDNLESQTYETFEKDPVKYVQYEEAIHQCLKDKLQAGKEAPFTVIVVGAGRGPLVCAVRRAADRLETGVTVWAVEKNPNAIITLQHRKKAESWDNVEVVGVDMRFWEAPQKADIIVSELLGSFGDNELSPECLDGAQKYLADDGTCIPQRYTSYLTPVTSCKLWNDVKNYNDLAHFETAYVVKFHQAFYPTKEIKRCFIFAHPNPELRNNDRYTDIDFTVEVDALVHGFAGYFHCELYADFAVSIEPNTHSDGMFSWFPIYFPLRTPIFVRKGQRLKSHWWRCHNDKKVWYEWTVSEPSPQPVHNPGGRSYYIGK